MKTKKIYLIRHGQTDYNLQGIVQGSKVNTSINELGTAQANAFYEFYKDVNFQKIYTSKLNRSIQSVQQFIDKGIKWEAFEGLNEISWGYRDGTVITDDENEYYFEVVRRWKEGEIDLKIDGGESPREVQARQKPVLDDILASDAENILICMHGRAIRIFLCLMLNKDLKLMDEFKHENLCLYSLNYSESTGFELDKKCDITHLEVAGLRSEPRKTK